MKEEARRDILAIARMMEKQAERCRIQSAQAKEEAYKNPTAENQAIHETLRYCGALSSLVSSTLCELVNGLEDKEIFSLSKTNAVLKEWGLDELGE